MKISVPDLTEKDQAAMKKYNIKSETVTLFYSEGYKYDNLKQALSYAKLAAERTRASVPE